MVVQHNMQAANANRMLNITTGAQSKSTEKLSSGYRINRAADETPSSAFEEALSSPRICFLIFSEIVSPAASSAARLIL